MAKKKDDKFVSESSLTIVGNVLENKLKVENDVIRGKIVIKYGDELTDVITLDMYTSAVYSTGNENKNYKTSLETLDNLVTLSRATTENPASVVVISGNTPAFSPKIETEKYWNTDKEEFNSIVKAKVGFSALEINNNLTKEDYRAEFIINTVILGESEFDEDGTTLIVKGATVDYKGGVHTLKFKVTDESLIDGLEGVTGLENVDVLRELCEEYSGEAIPFDAFPQLQLWGSASLASITVKEEKASQFGGKGQVVESNVFTSNLFAIGAQATKDFDAYALLEAYDNTEEYEANLKQKAEDKKSKVPTKKTKGFNSTGTKRRGTF
jgi:hypothetical protein